MKTLTFLFIPVSSIDGIGEYSRSLLIANHLKKSYPTASIYFLLNRHVNYIDSCPHQVILTNGSATKDSPQVLKSLKELSPDFVLFDASGRAKHFKAAKKLGATVAFISQHAKKRARGLQFNRLPYIDFHWVVQPDFAIKPLGLVEKLKLSLLSVTPPVNIGAVFDTPCEEQLALIKAEYQLTSPFVLFNAGSGGFKAPKNNVQTNNAQIDVIDTNKKHNLATDDYCIDVMYRAACRLYEQTGQQSAVVFGLNYPNALPKHDHVICIRSLAHQDFIALLMLAKTRVISAGDTLLQCIALKLPSISVAVTKDQPKRLKTCNKLGVTTQSTLSEQALVDAITNALTKESNAAVLDKLCKSSNLADLGLTKVINDISKAMNKREGI